MKYLFSLLLLSMLILSCGEDMMEEEQADTLEWEIGKNVYNQEVVDTPRNFIIHVPASYSGDEAVPLLFMLHGSSGTGEKFYNISRWVQKSEEEGFIAVFPTALEYPIVENNNRRTTKWSSDGLVNDIPPDYPIYDDVDFITELVELCKNTFNIDDARKYICGFSNGGGFVKSQVIPRMGDVFTAANTGGGPGLPLTYTVDHNYTMPLFTTTGTRDDRVVASSGVMAEVPITGEDLMASDYYRGQIENILDILQLSTSYTEAPNPPSYNIITWNESLSSQNTEFALMLINNMGHVYPNGNNNDYDIEAVDFVWPWFMQWER